jgi:hypothetical protein
MFNHCGGDRGSYNTMVVVTFLLLIQHKRHYPTLQQIQEIVLPK